MRDEMDVGDSMDTAENTWVVSWVFDTGNVTLFSWLERVGRELID